MYLLNTGSAVRPLVTDTFCVFFHMLAPSMGYKKVMNKVIQEQPQKCSCFAVLNATQLSKLSIFAICYRKKQQQRTLYLTLEINELFLFTFLHQNTQHRKERPQVCCCCALYVCFDIGTSFCNVSLNKFCMTSIKREYTLCAYCSLLHSPPENQGTEYC